MQVLVVDDDEETRELIGGALRSDGHASVLVASAPAATKALTVAAFDVVVLDVMLDGMSGLDLCGQLRRRGVHTPILFLSARGSVHARVDGLDAGADDYLTKPFAVRELLARVRALGRRGAHAPLRTVRAASVTLSFDARRAEVSGVEVPITAREWDLLRVLAEAQGRVVAFDDILERAWGEATERARASLEVIVSRLRRKLQGSEGGTALRTVRGLGYALEIET